MNPYMPETHRTVFAILAAALTGITIAMLVVMPAAVDSGFERAVTVAAANASSVAPIEVTIGPARIDVIAVRAPNVAWALDDKGKPNCKPEV